MVRSPVLAIAGPTGAGKTAIAVRVAELLDAVIVSADAMQVYRGMDIGTAKATPAERREVSHFGLDVVDPNDTFDAASFVTLADAVNDGERRVLLVGGTSLYHRAFTRGLVPTPPADAALRARLSAIEAPHAALALVDRVLAERLHPMDLVRILRGLEVHAQTGVPLSALQAAHQAEPDRVTTVGVWLDWTDVSALDRRIDARVVSMVADGYVQEVQGLLDAGYAREIKPMQSLGYRHLSEHLLDGVALEEAIRRTQRDTRRFARKQRTWQRTLRYHPVAAEVPQLAVDRMVALARERLQWSPV